MGNAVVTLAGKVINQAGSDKVGLTVQLYEAATWEAAGAATASTTTDADGKWAFANQDITKTWLICVTDGTKKYLIDARNKVQLTELDLITDLAVNTIYEHTAAAGVTIDGMLIKDGDVSTVIFRTLLTWSNVGSTALANADGAKYVLLNSDYGLVGTEGTTQIMSTRAGTLKRLYVRVTSNDTAGATTITVRKNLADTAITLSIAAATTGIFSDTTHTAAVVAGDLICVLLSVAAGAGTITIKQISLEFD